MSSLEKEKEPSSSKDPTNNVEAIGQLVATKQQANGAC